MLSFFRFRLLLTPYLTQGLFLMATLAVGWAAVERVIEYIEDGSSRGELRTLMLELVGLVGGWLLIRLWLEFAVISFSIHDRLIEIADEAKKQASR